jgi:hypothetical protein
MAVLVLEDHWTCALLRAELLERARDSECSPSLRLALLRRREAPNVIVVDQRLLSAPECAALEALAAMDDETRIVLLGGGVESPLGPWDRILRRPIRAAELLSILESALDGTLPRLRPRRIPEGVALRRSAPWPMIRCDGCDTTRNYEAPRVPHEMALVAGDAAMFVLEHGRCRIGQHDAGSARSRGRARLPSELPGPPSAA